MKPFIVSGITFIPIISEKILPLASYYLRTTSEQELTLERFGLSTLLTMPNYRSSRTIAKKLKVLCPDFKTVYVLASTTFVPLRYKQLPCAFCTDADNCTDDECRQDIENR